MMPVRKLNDVTVEMAREVSSHRRIAREVFGGAGAKTAVASTNGTCAAIVGLLEKHRAGMRATEIRKALGLSQKEIAPLVIEGLRSKKIAKTGVRRGTMYFAR